MQCIARFTERPPLICSDALLGDAAACLGAHPAASALAVAEEGQIVGLIGRVDVERAMAAGLGKGRVGQLMMQDPPTIDAACGIADALRIILSDPSGCDAFICVEDGRYAGVGALRALVPGLLSPVDGLEDTQRLLQTAEAEFRVHVQGLLAMADRLARQHLNPDAQAQVMSIKATGDSLLRLADDARDMLHARQGKLVLDPQPQALRDLMDAVQARWSERAAETGVSLLIAYDGDPDLVVRVDAARLAQIFDNLIDHALRYTRQGSVEASLRARADNDQVLLEGRVRDTGPGLVAARLARIFDAGAGPDGEAGNLPLSLTRGIVQSMKGSIRAESNVGQGMTIMFGLMAEAAGQAPPAEISPVSGAPHVLVVDDNATNRMVAEALCEMFDCTCETVEDGVEAVEAARTGRFDLILMDIKMPRMDGIAATRAIRELGGMAGAVPVVALTANVDPEDARSYIAAGMCCVVEKPIKPDRLLQAINIALSDAGEDAPRTAAA